jgi:hypothetical protein
VMCLLGEHCAGHDKPHGVCSGKKLLRYFRSVGARPRQRPGHPRKDRVAPCLPSSFVLSPRPSGWCSPAVPCLPPRSPGAKPVSRAG